MPYQPTLEQYEIIYNNASNAIFLIGVEAPGVYRVLSVNAVYLRWNHKAPGELVGKRVGEVYSGLALEHVRRRYGEAIAAHGPHRYEVPVEVVGDNQHIQTTLVPVYDESDTCTHIIGVVRNITRSKLEQRRLEDEKRKAEMYLDIAEALILALDRDGVVTLANRKGCQLLGHAQADILGRNWIDLVLPLDDRAAARAAFAATLAGSELPPALLNVVTANGETRRIRLATTRIHDAGGQVTGVLCSGEDVTDVERARQNEATTQRLLVAEEVVSAAAHDFNNSLQAIMGNIELALSSVQLPPEIRGYLDASVSLANDAATRIAVLRRNTTGQEGGAMGPVAINDLVLDVVNETRHYWEGMSRERDARVGVETHLADDVTSSLGSLGELRTVLYNVVKNAVEAIPGEGLVSISTVRDGAEHVIEVTDTGIGMDAETMTRIFQPLFSTKGYESGRGLGMTSANTIMLAHHGSVRVKATCPGAGTTIEMRLPRFVGADQVDDVGPPGHIKHRLLWVDDDQHIRGLARGYLDALQCEGDVAGSGEEALALMPTGNYSFVLTDLGMPDMNGFELARLIRAQYPDIRIVALTGWGDHLGHAGETPECIDQVIGKPVRLDDLRRLLAS